MLGLLPRVHVGATVLNRQSTDDDMIFYPGMPQSIGHALAAMLCAAETASQRRATQI